MAVTANQITISRNAGKRVRVPVVASTVIYEGTLVFAVAASGYATNDDAAGANQFLGIACAKADNSAGSSGDVFVEIFTEGDFLLTGSTLTQAMVGDRIYASDNYTITDSGTSTTQVGYCVEYKSATQLWIRLTPGDQTHPEGS